MSALDFVIRPAEEKDWNFISTAWLSTYAKSDAVQMIKASPELERYAPILDPGKEHPNPYYGLHRKLIEHLQGRAGVETLVACDKTYPDLLLGFACGLPGYKVLHYVCTKWQLKGNGIAEALLTRMFGGCAPQVITHITPEWKAFRAHVWPDTNKALPDYDWRYLYK